MFVVPPTLVVRLTPSRPPAVDGRGPGSVHREGEGPPTVEVRVMVAPPELCAVAAVRVTASL